MREVTVQDLKTGDLLWAWTKEARKGQGRWQVLAEGPEGAWQAMVLANDVIASRPIDGSDYPPVHKVDVFFWNDTAGVCFQSFHWTAGHAVKVMD